MTGSHVGLESPIRHRRARLAVAGG